LSWSFVNQYAYEAVNITPAAQSHLISGYVWANQPTAPAYFPSSSYQSNSAIGLPPVITRNGVCS
jgi:hypothetical protein